MAQLIDCVENGVDVNGYSANGTAALHILASKSDYEATEYLLNLREINREIRTSHSFTPLLLACLTAVDPYYVRFLLTKGCNPNISDRLGKRPIQYCVEKDSVQVVQWLIEFKAELNYADDLGNSPLSIAILDRSNFDMANLLLKHHADPDMERGTGTPLLFGIASQSFLYVKLIRHFSDCILACTSYLTFRNILLLFKFNTNPNIIHPLTKRNALHYASIAGYRPCVRELLNRNVNLNAKDVAGKTPVDIANDHCHYDILAMYIDLLDSEEIERILKFVDYAKMKRVFEERKKR